ncbi:MAG: dinitrogenase iron-molybdenum cofactor biosynthesis protein [Spirochaetaceae bacterium]|jgi:predicted Fe-Mo cluster-binding NifX family protein|nr:dinitrogenase iron-molybdenum cofactor biosynthesis protein [Spirochaetaceae bacterium]
MSWRVGIASIDGVLINEHFGRSKWFYIIDIEAGGASAVFERRPVAPLCQCGDHAASGMASALEALADCTAVLAAKIGPAARQSLEERGIAVFEEPAEIAEAVQKLAAYYARTGGPRQKGAPSGGAPS